MKSRLLLMAWVIASLVLTPTLPLFGSESFSIQGRVMEVDIKKTAMVVNEKQFVWDSSTLFYDDRGAPITFDRIRTKTWVYIEGRKDDARKRIIAEKIYLLPKYISENERHLYPFIK